MFVGTIIMSLFGCGDVAQGIQVGEGGDEDPCMQDPAEEVLVDLDVAVGSMSTTPREALDLVTLDTVGLFTSYETGDDADLELQVVPAGEVVHWRRVWDSRDDGTACNGNEHYRIAADVHAYVDGQLDVSGPTELEVAPGGRVTLWLRLDPFEVTQPAAPVGVDHFEITAFRELDGSWDGSVRWEGPPAPRDTTAIDGGIGAFWVDP